MIAIRHSISFFTSRKARFGDKTGLGQGGTTPQHKPSFFRPSKNHVDRRHPPIRLCPEKMLPNKKPPSGFLEPRIKALYASLRIERSPAPLARMTQNGREAVHSSKGTLRPAAALSRTASIRRSTRRVCGICTRNGSWPARARL